MADDDDTPLDPDAAAVLAALNGQFFGQLAKVAEDYLGCDAALSEVTITSQRILWTCEEYLRRAASPIRSDDYKRTADTLRAALKVLTDNADHFRSLMASGDGGACADRAVWSIQTMAEDFERAARLAKPKRKNERLDKCLGRAFAGMAPLTLKQADTVRQIINSAIHDAHKTGSISPESAGRLDVPEMDEGNASRALRGL